MEKKSLDLSKRRLRIDEYETIIQGLFSFLILNSVQLGEKEAYILALSSRLTHLDLSDNNIGDKGARRIGAGLLSTLTMLDLNNNSIGADGARGIDSGAFPALIALYMSYNNIKKTLA